MPPLHVMIKPVSGACNLHCKYCFYTDTMAHRAVASYGRMTAQTAENLVRRAFIYADDAITFSFQGGEPTLAGADFYRNFFALVAKYNTRALRVSYALQTNATLLTEELCALFAKQDFLVGVSLDGTKALHDALRDDSYDRALAGMALLKTYGIAFNILCVVTEPLAANPHAVWEALAPYGYLQFIPCIDGFDGVTDAYSLRPETYADFLIRTFDLYAAAFFSAKPVHERRLDNYLSVLLGEMPEMCGMCGKCGLYFLCEADGGVYPCDFYVLDAWKLGNINENSFARMEKSARMTEFRSAEPPADCRACAYFTLCRGGCRRDREGVEKSRFCESYRRFFAARLDAMQKLAKQIAGR